jgi:pyruvate formate lyase activating enzyme
MIKEARLWKALDKGKVECLACARACKIPDGSSGFCYVRQNRGGKLYLMNYGKLVAVQIDPIEKKPFNHFMPGSYVLGFGTSSCNFGCLFCQNHNISKDHEIKGVEITPEEAIEMAKKHGVDGMAYTYNEPTIFIEYALDVAKLAHGAGLFNVFVTNGNMTSDAINLMKGLVDAAVVDFKGNGEENFVRKFEGVPSNDRVKQSLVEMKKAGIHVEITDLVVPKVGDSLEECNKLTKWIKEELGPDTPLQFTRFFPDYNMQGYGETPYETLRAHYDTAKRNGLNYVYIGNVFGDPNENTYCPSCGNPVIAREGFYIAEWNLDKGMRCNKCHTKIPIAGRAPRELRRNGIRVLE